jgi:hypothetical protein
MLQHVMQAEAACPAAKQCCFDVQPSLVGSSMFNPLVSLASSLLTGCHCLPACRWCTANNRLQFHFHARAEHVIDGKEYPLELHIVNWVYAPTLPGNFLR